MRALRDSPQLTRRFRLALVLMIPFLWLGACQLTVNPREVETYGDHDKKDLAVSARQMRLQMRALVDPLCGEVESAADRILATTEDPAVRRAALEWKSQAIPALRESLFQSNPGMALFDTWVLTHQMTDYFTSGQGSRALGDRRALAVATCQRLEERMATVAAGFTKSGEVSRIRGLAREWAADHPIGHSIAHRESTLSRLAKHDLGPGLSATEAIGDLAMVVDDLNRRVETYSDQLFRQARWEAELAVDDLTRSLDLDQAIPLAGQAVDSFGRLTESLDTAVIPSLEKLTGVAEGVPDLVSGEREVVLQAVRSEVDRATALVKEERAIIMNHITAERVATVDSLHEIITGERVATVEALHELLATEREILTADLGTLSIEAIDHAFLRTAQLAAVLLVAGVVLLLVLLVVLRFFLPRLAREIATLKSASAS